MVPWVFVMVIGRKRFGEDFVVERKGLLSYMTGFHLFYSVEEGFAGFLMSISQVVDLFQKFWRWSLKLQKYWVGK